MKPVSTHNNIKNVYLAKYKLLTGIYMLEVMNAGSDE